MKKTTLLKIAACSLALNLVGCSGQYGGGGANFNGTSVVTLLAAAVPVGAIITLTDDGDGGTISTTQNDGMMVSALPTSRISNAVSGNTITWTIMFSENVSGITASQFRLTGGGTLGTLSGSGRSYTITSTHTASADVSLRYVGSLAQQSNLESVAFTAQLTPEQQAQMAQMATEFLSAVPSSGDAANSSATIDRDFANAANTERTFTSQTAQGITTITLTQQVGSAAVTTEGTYRFLTAPNSDNQLISENGDAMIIRYDGADGSSPSTAYTLYTGTNIGETNQAITAFDFLVNAATRTPTTQTPTAEVGYTGTYSAMKLPTDSDNGIRNGTFEMNVIFGGSPHNIFGTGNARGIARGSDGRITGRISGGSISNDNGIVFSIGSFIVEQTTDTTMRSVDSLEGFVTGSTCICGFAGEFTGTNANGILGYGTFGSAGNAAERGVFVMSGERQSSTHNINMP